MDGTPLSAYPVRSDLLPVDSIVEGRYEAKFVTDTDQLDAALQLRFEVFNLELGEGLEDSYATRRDVDQFDAVCHHLVVIERESQQTVGTYRMQTGAMAECNSGFYSAGEFELDGLTNGIVEKAVEVGRACIAKNHRNTQVLFLLWRGLAKYMAATNHRYLFGCCSLTSQDLALGRQVMSYLRASGHVHPSVSVQPKPGLECFTDEQNDRTPSADSIRLPKLFRIYLRHGAKVCGPPAIDREFKTIDYLVLFDLEDMTPKQHRVFFST